MKQEDLVKNEKPLTASPLLKPFYWSLLCSLTLGPSWQAYAADTPAQAQSQADSSKIGTSADLDTSEDETATSNPATVLSSGFLLHLNSPDDAKLNGDFRVTVDGKIFLPYNIVAQAAGVKLGAFQSKLIQTYRPYFKTNPRVNVTVKQKRYWVRVLGLVKAPGTYLLKQNTTLDEALALAQVNTSDLQQGYARLGNGNQTHWISLEDYLKGGHAHNLAPWQGGEQILFQLERPEGESTAIKDMAAETVDPSVRKVQVLGEVRNPGNVSFQKNADGYYYMIQRGGPTQFSNLEKVEVLRLDPITNERRSVTLGDISEVKEVHEADVIMVHPERPSKTERTLATLGIVATILSAVALTIVVARDTK